MTEFGTVRPDPLCQKLHGENAVYTRQRERYCETVRALIVLPDGEPRPEERAPEETYHADRRHRPARSRRRWPAASQQGFLQYRTETMSDKIKRMLKNEIQQM